MPKANPNSSFVSVHPPIPLPYHPNSAHNSVARRSSTTISEVTSLPPAANAASSTTHNDYDDDENQNKQIVSLPFNWQVKLV